MLPSACTPRRAVRAICVLSLVIAACGEQPVVAPVDEVASSRAALSISPTTTITSGTAGSSFPAIGDQLSAAAGRFSATNALVAYYDLAPQLPTLDFVRMDALGQRIGDPATLATNVSSRVKPAVACNATTCLVVYGDGAAVRGIRVDAAGTIIDAVPIAFGASPWLVSLAAHDDGANGVIVAWSDSGTQSGTVFGVYARRMSSAGALVGASPTTLANAVVGSAEVSVSAFGGTAIVAWDDYSGGTVGRIQGARLDLSGATLDASPLTVVDSGSAAERAPRLIARASDLVLLYVVGPYIYGRTVTLSPTFSVSNQTPIVYVGGSGAITLAARSDGTTGMFCTSVLSSSYYQVNCGTLSSVIGNTSTPSYLSSIDALSSLDVLPMNGNRVLIAAVRHDHPPVPLSNGYDVQTGPTAATMRNLTAGAASLRDFAASYATGGQFGLTFIEDAAFPGSSVRFTRVATTGTVVDATPRLLSTGAVSESTVTQYERPIVGAIGALHQLLWQEATVSLYATTSYAIDGVTVDQALAPATGILRRFTNLRTPYSIMSGSTRASVYMAQSATEIRDWNVTPTTDYAGSGVFSTFTGVRADAERAVIWRSAAFAVLGQGASTATTHATTIGDDGGLSVANGTRSTLVVRRNAAGGAATSAVAVLLNTNATAVTRASFSVENTAGLIGPVRVVFDGTYYDVVFARANQLELIRVNEDGQVIDPMPSILASDVASLRSAPAVATDRAGKVFVAYEIFDAARAVRAKRISTLVVDWNGVGDGDPLGTPCSGAIDCGSGLCIDGVCCNTACGFGSASDCQSCSVATGAAADGTCGPVAQTTVCRTASGVCDVAETCDGTSTLCPADGFVESGTICGALGSTPCETDQRCTGAGAACPAKVPRPNTTVCRGASDSCDAVEYCTGNSINCPQDGVLAANTVCRLAVEICDQTDVCNGVSTACGADALAPTTKQCRAAVGVCDAAEFCSGSAKACPSDIPAQAGTLCRAAPFGCDVAESCDGTSFTCPANAFQPSTVLCREAVAVCDAPEYCSGLGPSCPGTDSYRPEGTLCRVAGGVCDISEVCTGASAFCPADTRRGAETICRPATSLCDTAETCVSNSIQCPPDRVRVDGSSCGNGLVCDGAEVCEAGACVAGEALVCEAESPCLESTGECSVPTNPGGCSVAVAGTPASGREVFGLGLLLALFLGMRRRVPRFAKHAAVAAIAFGLGGCVCGVGRVTCDDACVDVGYDEANCGGCGVSCGYGQCIEGECVSLPTTNITCDEDEACRDGNVCNGVERCVSGRCRAGEPVLCDDGSSCTTDACSPAVGSCVSSLATITCQD